MTQYFGVENPSWLIMYIPQRLEACNMEYSPLNQAKYPLKSDSCNNWLLTKMLAGKNITYYWVDIVDVITFPFFGLFSIYKIF